MGNCTCTFSCVYVCLKYEAIRNVFFIHLLSLPALFNFMFLFLPSSLSLHLPSLPPALFSLSPSPPLQSPPPPPPPYPLPTVMRMAGSRRLLLNSNMWTEMSCEKVNAKSIRFTGQDIDSDSIRIFLIKVTGVTAKGGGSFVKCGGFV